MILIKSVLGLVAVLVTLCMLAVRLQDGADLPLIISNHFDQGLRVSSPANGRSWRLTDKVELLLGVHQQRLVVVDSQRAMQLPIYPAGRPTNEVSLLASTTQVVFPIPDACHAVYYDYVNGVHYAADLCDGRQIVLGTSVSIVGWSSNRDIVYFVDRNGGVIAADLTSATYQQVSEGRPTQISAWQRPIPTAIVQGFTHYERINLDTGHATVLLQRDNDRPLVSFHLVTDTVAIYQIATADLDQVTLYWRDLRTNEQVVLYDGVYEPVVLAADPVTGNLIFFEPDTLQFLFYRPTTGIKNLGVDVVGYQRAESVGVRTFWWQHQSVGARMVEHVLYEFDVRNGTTPLVYRGALIGVEYIDDRWLIGRDQGRLFLLERDGQWRYDIDLATDDMVMALPVEVETVPRGVGPWLVLIGSLVGLFGLDSVGLRRKGVA